MSTRAKILVAGGIVAALVGIIIYDAVLNQPAPKNSGSGTPQAAQAKTAASPQPEGGLPLELGNALEDGVRRLDARMTEAMTQPTVERLNAPAPTPPPPTPSPAPVPKDETYEVKAGDTLSAIAELCYGDQTKYRRILEANPGINPDALRVGAKLKIPKSPSAPSSAEVADASPTEAGGLKAYVIQAGDSLAKIATRFYKSERFASALFQANKNILESPDFLHVGTKITLPDLKTEPATVVAGDTPPEQADKKTYRVRSGDSLWKISKQFAQGRSVQEVMDQICAANPDRIPSTGTPLQVGWVLTIPETSR